MKNVATYSKSFEYLRYKKFFFMEIQKTRISDMKKLQKVKQILKCKKKVFGENCFWVKKNIWWKSVLENNLFL